MKRVLTSLAAALALAVPALAQVAQIGDTTYADFNSFFTAFQAIAPSETPTTVTLLDDLTGDLAVPGTVPVKEGQTIVFDLNGRTMETALQREGRHYYAIDNYGTLTIKDSSAGQTGTIRARGVQNLGNGKLTIEGGTIVSVDANGGACVWNEADVTIAGGTFTTEFVGTPSDSSGPGCLNNSGTALVTGGTFHNVNRRTYAIISNMGAIEITPAEGAEVKVFGAHGGLGVDGGTAVVNGGSYSSSDFYGLYVSNDGLGADPMQAAVTVNDGTFDGKSYSVWVGSDYNNPVNSTIAIKGGTFLKALNRQDVSRPNAIQVSGGTFSTAVPEEFCTAGYASKQNADGTYSVVGWYESGVDLDADGVADAWVIRNEGDLAAFRDKVNGNVTFAGCTVTLAANLDLAGVAWIPIGEGNAGGASKNGGFFAGTFEGGNLLIANLSVSESKAGEGAGLFGWVRGATIRNLSVSGSILSNANGAAGGSMHGNIAVSGRTAVDKPLTTAQVNEALACFEGSGLIVVEGSLEGEKTLVVAYDFGITDVRVTGTGDLVVEVAAQDMSGRPLAFAEGASLSLRNGETALAATPATVEGVTTFTVPAANVPAGNLALSVSVAPAAAEEAPAN